MRLAWSCLLLLLCGYHSSGAQEVSEIITDFGGFWQSSTTSPNSIKPNHSHHLLAFSFNGQRYSTGVNDNLLTAQSVSFQEATFTALPIVQTIDNPTGNTKIGLGSRYDGVANGAGDVAEIEAAEYYLTDGTQGLDIGTGIANVPASTIDFNLSQIFEAAIGDGIPDILVTQIAQPSGSNQDVFSFRDAQRKQVGNSVSVVFNQVASLGTWTADFYEASTNPYTLTSGFTETDRNIRIFAADLSDFGITSMNYTDITQFSIAINGSSDLAFVAYNTSSYTLAEGAFLLPVEWKHFSAKQAGPGVQLTWITASESNADYFAVERRGDTADWQELDRVKAVGNSQIEQTYQYIDRPARRAFYFYRLRQVDVDGSYSYSNIVALPPRGHPKNQDLRLYPTLCRDHLVLEGPTVGPYAVYQTSNGQRLLEGYFAGGWERIEVADWPSGQYVLIFRKGPVEEALRFVVLE